MADQTADLNALTEHFNQSVRQAQERLAKKARGDGPAQSAEAWFAAYLPESK